VAVSNVPVLSLSIVSAAHIPSSLLEIRSVRHSSWKCWERPDRKFHRRSKRWCVLLALEVEVEVDAEATRHHVEEVEATWVAVVEVCNKVLYICGSKIDFVHLC